MGSRKFGLAVALVLALCVSLALVVSTLRPESGSDHAWPRAPTTTRFGAADERVSEQGAASPASAREPGPADVAGTVRDVAGDALPGATVRSLRLDRLDNRVILSTRTDPHGAYTLGPIEGVVFLEARTAGHVVERRRAVAGDRHDFILGAPGIVVGTVVQADGGAPCEDAIVELWRQRPSPHLRRTQVPAASSRTDAEGAFRVEGVRPGIYVGVVHPRRGPRWPAFPDWNVIVRPGSETRLEVRIAPAVAVTGRILEEDTGRPVAGVEIGLVGSPRLLSVSDASGRYRIEGLPRGSPLQGTWGAGRWMLDIRVPRGSNLFVPRARGLGQFHPDGRGQDVILDVRLPRGGSIRGVVMSPDGGLVAGALVSRHLSYDREADDLSTTVTDDRGVFHLTGVPPGGWALYAAKPGFARIETTRVKVKAGAVTEGVVITLPGGGELSGHVLDELGQPVAGATVYFRQDDGRRYQDEPLNPRSRVTDGRGVFAFDGVPARRGWLEIGRPGYIRQVVLGLKVAAGEHRSGVEVVLRRGVVLSGRVVDDRGQPAPAVEVVVRVASPHPPPIHKHLRHRTEVSVRSDQSGRFEASGLPDGPSYSLRANGVDAVTWRPGDPDPVLVAPSRAEGVVTGRVTLAVSTVLGFHEVRIVGKGVHQQATGSGDEPFSFEGLVDGPYVLDAVGNPGWLSAPVEIEVIDGRPTAPVHLVLVRGGTVTGRVTDLEGNPSRGEFSACRVVDAKVNIPVRSGRDGRFVFGPVLPGAYRFVARRQGGEARAEVQLAAGAETEIDLNMTAREAIFVRVSDPEGKPVRDAEVIVRSPDGAEVRLDSPQLRKEYAQRQESEAEPDWEAIGPIRPTTRSRGTVLIRPLPPGRYLLQIIAPGFAPARAEATIPPDGFARVSVTLQREPK